MGLYTSWHHCARWCDMHSVSPFSNQVYKLQLCDIYLMHHELRHAQHMYMHTVTGMHVTYLDV